MDQPIASRSVWYSDNHRAEDFGGSHAEARFGGKLYLPFPRRVNPGANGSLLKEAENAVRDAAA